MIELNFDMDGTIADFYSQENWLEDLEKEKVRPYRNAKPLYDKKMVNVLNQLRQSKKVKINIISWSSKCGSQDFHKRIKDTKIEWLKKHKFPYDEAIILPYGESKEKYGKGVLFDDEEQNRKNWETKENNIALTEKEIISFINSLINEE